MKKFRLKNRHIFWGIVILMALAIIPQAFPKTKNLGGLVGPKQASLYFVEPTSAQYVTQTFPLEVHIKTHRVAVNTVKLHLKYDPRVLEIIDMSSEKSFCSFYVANSFDNIKGEVNITCGKPSPGFTGDSILVKLTMRGKIVSSTQVSLENDTKVLANDGKGTNIFHSPSSVSFSIKSSF